MGKPTQTVASAWPELTVRPFVPSGRGIVGGGGGDEWGEVGGGGRGEVLSVYCQVHLTIVRA